MSIKATITIDDDRWAKYPFGVKFDDEECNEKYRRSGLSSWEGCYRIIEMAKADGYDIDPDVDKVYY